MQLLFNRFAKLLDYIWESKWKDILLPLSLQFGSLVIFGLFYVGLAYQENPVRTYGYALIQFLFLVLCGLAALSALKNCKMSKVSWVCLSLVLVFYGAYFIVGFSRYGFHDATLRTHFISFAALLAPFFGGILGALSHSEQRFLPLMEHISFFTFPAGLIYFNCLIFNCSPFTVNGGPYLGMIGYMPFAYTIMPVLLVHIIQFVNKEALEIPIIHRTVNHPQLVRGIFIAVYWIAIIGSGTRGVYVCVAGFCVLFVLSQLLHRGAAGRAFIVSALMAIVLLFNIFVYAPPAMHAVVRMDMVIEGLMQGKIVTTRNESKDVQDKIDALVEASSDKQVANRKEESTTSPEAPDNTEESTTSPEAPDNTGESTTSPEAPDNTGESTTSPEASDNIADENLVIGNRETLYKLALKEFLKSPLTGMGPGRFRFKYGMYPHNVVLELLADTGLLGSVPMLLFVLFSIMKLAKAGWTNCLVRYFLLFLMAYAMKAMYSAGICNSPVFLGALGYGLAFQIPRKSGKTKTLESPAEKTGSVSLDGNA